VFLPPNQRVSGTLALYNLNYNFAIVSVEKNFHAVRPEDIFNESPKASEKVIAVGRDADQGLLMASIGEVIVETRTLNLTAEILSYPLVKSIRYSGEFLFLIFYMVATS